MAERLSGYRILILETREEAQFSKLLTEQGADVLQCPMFAINDPPDPQPSRPGFVTPSGNRPTISC
jgi:uroporphyrinogen-III synthase